MNRIIVLGSSGYLGKSIREKLSKTDHKVLYMVHKKNKIQKNEFFGDVLNKQSLLKILKNNDLVLNLVGQYTNSSDNFFNTNLFGSYNLLEAAKIKKNIKIIFASSINVYGNSCNIPFKETNIPNPSTFYGTIKFLTEQLYQKYSEFYDLNVIILRFSNVYGKNKKCGIISNIIKSSKKMPVTFTHNGRQQRDFLYIDDAVDSIMKAISYPSKNFEIFNISSNSKITPKQISKIIENISKIKIHYKLSKNTPDEKCIWADNSKARIKLKFAPKISFKKGMTMNLSE